MVLQDATGPPNNGSLSDDPFPSDGGDPYSTASSSASSVDFSNLPRPVPIIGGLVGYSNRRIQANTKQALREAEKVMKRPMTYEEATALSYIWAKKSSIASYGAALGAGGALYQAYRTRTAFRYPFWTPNPEKFNPNEFFFVKGTLARRLFHTTRVIPYFILGRIVGSFFGESWGTFYAITQTKTDAALKEFHEAMVQRASQVRGPPRQSAPGQSSPDGSAWPKQPSRPTHIPTPAQKNTTNDDDMSPTAGNDAWSNSFDSSSDLSDTSAGQSPTPDTAYGKEAYNRPTRAPERSTARDETSPSSSGMFPGETEQEKASTGSSWERIRRSSASQASSPPQKSRPLQETQREGSTLGDSFSFSSTDEERQLAKAEAQREFDARVERERKGDDFEDRKKRW
ncbi:uncharacterized protein BDZ99DRAFT_502240 [Mytilinidion resinicola]|uniref:Uncharacterized protein n=1 Tax=Mytilinidion resinicola TaxID=574789 RepID=A0A6A6YAC9_9PEZI|nr:uncharacterized protein BDZ99DRAFT_502240 [Mytilinidion resinicola]KAF2804777.1 hypothetical protein BDZ99DRAFT_502240 [Mytilinidion resinicola]